MGRSKRGSSFTVSPPAGKQAAALAAAAARPTTVAGWEAKVGALERELEEVRQDKEKILAYLDGMKYDDPPPHPADIAASIRAGHHDP